MIENDHQFEITKTWAERFRRAIAELEASPIPDGIAPEIRKVELDAMRSTVEELEADLIAYAGRGRR